MWSNIVDVKINLSAYSYLELTELRFTVRTLKLISLELSINWIYKS